MKSKINIAAGLLIMVIVCAAAIEPSSKSAGYKNLQILPKDISEKALMKIMETDFSKGLGVTCDYCHAKKTGSTDLDYPSDTKSEKEAARSMMRMTIEINQKYFGQKNLMIGDSLMTITCKSCHQGEPYPAKN